MYATKNQNKVEDMVTLYVNAFEKASKRTVNPEETDEVRGRRTINSMLNTLTTPQDIAEPMAALYLLRGSPFYFSHVFSDLYISKAVKTRNAGDIEVSLSFDAVNSEFVSKVDQYHDYIYRPEALMDLCMYDFVIGYCKRAGIQSFKVIC
jgi:hypothetical protein